MKKKCHVVKNRVNRYLNTGDGNFGGKQNFQYYSNLMSGSHIPEERKSTSSELIAQKRPAKKPMRIYSIIDVIMVYWSGLNFKE